MGGKHVEDCDILRDGSATVDGQELDMVFPGSGRPEGKGGCVGARFEGFAPMHGGDIAVEVRNGNEVLHQALYANMLAPRSLTLVAPAAGEIRMNERVALQWSPKTDDLRNSQDGPTPSSSFSGTKREP